jgi:hypothetical protein
VTFQATTRFANIPAVAATQPQTQGNTHSFVARDADTI